MNIFEDVQFEDLKGEQREIAELIGFDNYLKLVEKYDGEPIPIPKASSLLRPLLNFVFEFSIIKFSFYAMH